VLPDGSAVGNWRVEPTRGLHGWWLRAVYACVFRPLRARGVRVGRPKVEVTLNYGREEK